MDFNKINLHLKIIRRCCKRTKRGIAIIATFKRSRYPHVYPRDIASVCKTLKFLTRIKQFSEQAYKLLEGCAKFMCSVQSKSGRWGQRYSISGFDRSIYKQEDNNAHGSLIILYYLLASHKLNLKIKNEKKFVVSIVNGLNYAINNYFNKDVGLFYSTTAIHESVLEKGYSIWVNFAYWHALNLVKELHKYTKYKKALEPLINFRDNFDKQLKKSFIQDERFIARICNGKVDLRPDITLLSPFYFNYKPRKILENSVRFIRKQLWDSELNLIQRYMPVQNDLAYHLHAGYGPWIQYSSILAQYYFWSKRFNEGDEILRLIDGYATKRGYLPEHVSTEARFKEFIKNEWKTGLDFKKEFDPEILLPHIDFDKIIEELFYMKQSYDRIRKRLGKHKNNIIKFGIPLVWSHSEYINALIMKG